MLDSDVVKAILESYLTIRIKEKTRGWTDFEPGKTIPKSPDVANKLKEIITLVKLLPHGDVPESSFENSDDWFKFIYKCREIELVEEANKAATCASYGGLGSLAVSKEARLEQALCAIRSYLITQMNTTKSMYISDPYSTVQTDLTRIRVEISRLTTDIDSMKKNTRNPNHERIKATEAELKNQQMQYDAVNHAIDATDHILFFNDFIKTRDIRNDAQGKPVIEATFDDFCSNVIKPIRCTHQILNQVMLMEKALFAPVKPSEPTSSTWVLGTIFKKMGSASPEAAAPAAPKLNQ